MTSDGQIRHASYVAPRSDEAAKPIRKEVATPAASTSVPASAGRPASTVRVTNLERVIDDSTGLTKLDLVRYYGTVADFTLPHLKARLCSLVRGPSGAGGRLFFHKHSERTAIPGLKNMDPALAPGHDPLPEVPSAAALAGAAQMNVIEFHTWNATARNIDKPDRMIFDLDPGEGTQWAHVQEADTLVRGLLEQLSLKSWLKTSGGNGLHIAVPLAPKFDYDAVKTVSMAIVEHLARVILSWFVSIRRTRLEHGDDVGDDRVHLTTAVRIRRIARQMRQKDSTLVLSEALESPEMITKRDGMWTFGVFGPAVSACASSDRPAATRASHSASHRTMILLDS